MTEPIVTQIEGVFLPVQDFDGSIAWYENLLGFTIRWKQPDVAAELEVGNGTTITLVMADSFQPIRFPYFTFATPDVQAAHDRLRGLGVQVSEVQEADGAQRFQCQDHDGNVLMITST